MFFFILLAYYCIKPLREGWIAVSDIQGLTKMEVKAYSSFFQSFFLLFIVGWYARLSGTLDRVSLITRATLFCASNMVLFWFLHPGMFFENLPYTGVIFYLWVGMFGVFIVAQFWTFCADVYADGRGTRLLPMVAIGATSGAASGSWLVSRLLASGLVSTESLLLVATVPLLASILLTRIVDRREGSTAVPAAVQETDTEEPRQGLRFLFSGVRLILISRFFFAAAMVTLLTNWVNTNGENLMFRVIEESLAGQAAVQGITNPVAVLAFTRSGTTQFYGIFFLLG